MATIDTCRGLDASVPPEVLEALKLFIQREPSKRRGDYLDGGDEGRFRAPSKAYCLRELQGEPRCTPDTEPLEVCLYAGLAKVSKPDDFIPKRRRRR